MAKPKTKYINGIHVRILSDGKGGKRKFNCLYKDGKMVKKTVFAKKSKKKKVVSNKKDDHYSVRKYSASYSSSLTYITKNSIALRNGKMEKNMNKALNLLSTGVEVQEVAKKTSFTVSDIGYLLLQGKNYWDHLPLGEKNKLYKALNFDLQIYSHLDHFQFWEESNQAKLIKYVIDPKNRKKLYVKPKFVYNTTFYLIATFSFNSQQKKLLNYIYSKGGNIKQDLTKNVDYVISNAPYIRTIKMAKDLDIPIISTDQFYQTFF